MTFTVAKSGVREIRQGDKDWMINSSDGLVQYPRAFVSISNRCPENLRLLLGEAMHHGWVKLHANVYERELTWEKLNETE